MDKKEILTQLKDLQEALEARRLCQRMISANLDSLAKDSSSKHEDLQIKPEPPELIEVSEKPDIKKDVIKAVASIVMYVVTRTKAFFRLLDPIMSKIPLWQVFAVVILYGPLVVLVKSIIRIKRFPKKNAEYKKELDYAENVYPKLKQSYDVAITAYNKKYKEIFASEKAKFESIKADAERALPELNEKIRIIGSIISSNYYNDLSSIISIIENGRADTVKEAVNVYEADVKALALISEERARRAAQERYYESQLAEQRAMRRAQEEQNARMFEMEQQRNYDMQRQIANQEKETRERERQARNRGSVQCGSCGRLFHGCPLSVQSGNTGNCANWTPQY